jgi:hypothetical protein
MIKTFQSILQEYYDRNKKYFSSENIFYEMNGAVLCNTNVAIFNFHKIAIGEITAYCKEQGYDVDKVVFVSSYDLDIIEEKRVDLNIKMRADSKIRIVKENDKVIAMVCIGEKVEISEK